MKPTIIIIGGVPGTGKSTLARSLSEQLNVSAYSKDELEAAVVRKGLCSSKQTLGVGYEIMAVLAKNQIDNNRSVILDFVASKHRVEQNWPQLFNFELKLIECTCSDEKVHKERFLTRNRNIEGWYELNWVEVQDVKERYHPLISERLILDSSGDLVTNISKAIQYISDETDSPKSSPLI